MYMWNLIMMMILSLTMMFMFLNNPLSMAITLVAQTLLVSLIIALLSSTFWYSYMLILVMVSGLLIMFMYLASIASNEKFNFSFGLTTTIMLISFLITLMTPKEEMLDKKLFQSSKLLDKQELMMVKLFNSKFIIPSIMMITFLFMMMVIISFLVNSNEGPMRKSN
nr:NADH dehydrogenase subunit 6 [Plerochila australis]